MKAKFDVGQNILIISNNKVGTINNIILRNDNVAYRVTVDGRMSTYQEKYLDAFVNEEQSIMDALFTEDYRGVEDFFLFQTWYRLKRPIEGNLYSYLASRTTFNPFQFKPLTKFISQGSEERLFIADEVGVGKTIETGIIFTELLGRGRMDRKSPILIVCPGILGPKWVKEMKRRFNLQFHLHDGNSLRNALQGAIQGVIPDGHRWAVVGLQLLRQKTNLELLQRAAASRQSPIWSMIVIDEAHHMRNVGTESNMVGNTLSGLTEMMIMLSATPLNLKDEDLFQQMHILNPSLFPDLQTFEAFLSPIKSINRCKRLLMERNPMVYGDILHELNDLKTGALGVVIATHPSVQQLEKLLFNGSSLTALDVAKFDRMLISLSPLDSSFTRTLKREAIEHRVTREVMKVPVRLTDEEMAFHEGVIETVERTYLERGGNPAAIGFITNMPRRMVSSSIPAMKDYLDWCLRANVELIEDGDSFSIAEDDSEFSTTSMTEETRELFVSLREKAEALGEVDTKYDQFRALIEQLRQSLPNPQIVVFSFFVRTLKYLLKRLTAEGFRVGLVCGEVPVTSDGAQLGRYDIIEAFESKKLDILLSSEVGGEGLDFQFCQAIVNYDLPYNPMRIEQRIGRIDRFGQTAEKVIAASMYIEGTVDERIYSLLYDRIGLVEASVGLMEAILGSSLVDLQRDVVSGQFSESQLEVRMREIETAIEQAKMEMERFERQRQELMGEDHFTSPLHRLEQSNDFVSPMDASRLTGMFVKSQEDCSYEVVDDDRGRITLSKQVVGRLEQYTRTPGAEGSLEELAQMLRARATIPVVFNGNRADQYRDHVFLPPSGFWVRFLIRQFESWGNMPKVFSLRLLAGADHGLPKGNYVVPLFEVKIEGFRVELTLSGVPVNSDDLQVYKCNYDLLPRLLGNDAQAAGDFFMEADIDFNQCIDVGREALEIIMEEKMEELRTENRYRVEARIRSLEKGAEVRIARLLKQIEEHIQNMEQQGKKPSEEFIRLKEAQIANDSVRTMEKIESLQKQKELSFSASLVATVLLQIEE